MLITEKKRQEVLQTVCSQGPNYGISDHTLVQVNAVLESRMHMTSQNVLRTIDWKLEEIGVKQNELLLWGLVTGFSGLSCCGIGLEMALTIFGRPLIDWSPDVHYLMGSAGMAFFGVAFVFGSQVYNRIRKDSPIQDKQGLQKLRKSLEEILTQK